MKKLTGLIVLVLVLTLGGYYAMGVVTERTVKKNLDVINQANGLTADVIEYKRGWFTSNALLSWRLHVPERVVKSTTGQIQTQPAQDYQMQMPLKVYHGPIIFSDRGVKFGLGYAHTDLNLPVNVAKQFKTVFTDASVAPEISMNLFVNFLNTSHLEMGIPQFKLIAKEGHAEFDWQGMNSVMSTTSSLQHVEGNFTVDGLRFVKDLMTSRVSNIKGEYTLHKTQNGLYLGDASLSVPSIQVQANDQTLFELSEFSLKSNSDITDGLFSSYFKTSLHKVFLHGKTYGPGSIQMAIKNLDAEVLARINAQSKTAQYETDLEKKKAMLMLLPELPRLFAKGAEFEISEMTLTMPEGAIEGNLMLSLPKEETQNPFQLIQKLEGQGKIIVPLAVLKEALLTSMMQKQATQASQLPAPAAVPAPAPGTLTVTTPAVVDKVALSIEVDKHLQSMVQSGLLVQQGTDYTLEIKLSHGQFLVNGKPFNSAMLAF